MRITPDGLNEHLAKLLPRRLYHYTSLDTLQKILATKSIFASNAVYLNDSREVAHAVNAIAKRIKILLKDNLDAELRMRQAHLADLLSGENMNSAYVTSFSEKRDDLSQWRGYTPNGQGACIAFDSERLKAAVKSLGEKQHPIYSLATVGKVIYLDGRSGQTFDKLIHEACRRMDVAYGGIARSINADRLIYAAAPLYKHRAFRDEKEWRIVLSRSINFEQLPGEGFRIGASTLIPFVPISLGMEVDRCIVGVTVGPTVKMKLSINALRRYFSSIGLENVHVAASKVPFRHW